MPPDLTPEASPRSGGASSSLRTRSSSSSNLKSSSGRNLRSVSSRNVKALTGDMTLQTARNDSNRLMKMVSSLYTTKGTEEDKALASAKLWQISTDNRRKRKQLEALHCPPHQRSIEDLKVIESVCKDVPLLDELSPSTRMEFLRAVGYVYWPEEGTFVYKKGEKGDAFFCVLSGSVAVVMEHEETRREMQVGSHRAGETFGELALIFPGGTRHASIRTVQPCEFLRIEKADYDRILRPIQDEKHSKRLALIYRLPVFRDLPRQQVEMLSYYMSERVAPPGQVIARQGEEADSLFIMQKGEARVLQAIRTGEGGPKGGGSRSSREGSSMSFAPSEGGRGGGGLLRRNSASSSRGGWAGAGGGGGSLRRSSDVGLGGGGSRRDIYSAGVGGLRHMSSESLTPSEGGGAGLGHRLSLASTSRRELMRVPQFGSAPSVVRRGDGDSPRSPGGAPGGSEDGEDGAAALEPEQSGLGELPSPPPGGAGGLMRGGRPSSFRHSGRSISGSRESLSRGSSSHSLLGGGRPGTSGTVPPGLSRRSSTGPAQEFPPLSARGPEMSARSLRRRSSDGVGVASVEFDAEGRMHVGGGGGALTARAPSSRGLSRASFASSGSSLSSRAPSSRVLRRASFGGSVPHDEPSSVSVLSKQTAASSAASGKRYIEVATFKAGEFFGHVEAVNQEPYRRSLVSSTGCEVLVLSRFDLNRRLDAAARDELKSLQLKTSNNENLAVEDEGTLRTELKKTEEWEEYKAKLVAELTKNRRPVQEGARGGGAGARRRGGKPVTARFR